MRSDASKFVDNAPTTAWFAAQPPCGVEQFQQLWCEWLRIHSEFADRTDWCATVLADVLAQVTGPWQSLAKRTEGSLAEIRRFSETVGEPVIENAENLSIVRILADAEDLLRHLKSGQGLGWWIFRADVVRRTEYLWSPPSLCIPQPAPSIVEGSPNHNVRPVEVLACLFQAKEPLTAGQIRWRTKLSEDIWPDVERDLLQRNLIRKNGTGKRARFELLVEKPAEGPSQPAPAVDAEVVEVTAETWFKLSRWAKQQSLLEPWQRGLAYSLGRIKRDGDTPTEKQIRQGRRILDESRQLGFFDDVTLP